MDYTIFVLCLVVLCTSSVNGWWWGSEGRLWSDTVPSDCPSEDSNINVCGTLATANGTCITLKCCGATDYDSEEYAYSTETYTDDEYEASRAEYEAENECDAVCISVSQCTVYKCYERCCDGYERDYYGRCRNETGGIDCENGGTRVGEWCLCPAGFLGKSCEIPVCTSCLNGGECIVKNGQPYCNCTSDYYGKMCEFAKCSLECQNGGKCYKKGGYEVCRCPAQYIGKYCEQFFTNSGACPAPEYNEYCEPRMECTNNEGCSDDLVCCYNGCGTVCKTPVMEYCEYEGRVFKIGESFKKDACSNCTCTAGGVIRCYSQTCHQRLECPNGRQPEQRRGECCPTCSDEPTYKPPTIRNCPNTTVSVNTDSYSDYVNLDVTRLNICAFSGDGRKLEVKFRPTVVSHPKTTTNNKPTLVTAYAVDRLSNSVYCQFSVIVRDIYKPVFHSCPADIYVFDDEPARWVEPRYTDNVGVLRLDKYGQVENGDMLRIGKYKITYRIQDFDHNTAECSFYITVTAKDTDFVDMPQGLQQRSKDENAVKLTVIIAPIVGGLLIVGVILTLVVCYRCKLQQRSETTGTQSSSPGYGNNIYAVPCDVKDEVKDHVKLPEYTACPLPLNPPVYSETGSLRGSVYEPESPPSYHNPDYDSSY